MLTAFVFSLHPLKLHHTLPLPSATAAARWVFPEYREERNHGKIFNNDSEALSFSRYRIDSTLIKIWKPELRYVLVSNLVSFIWVALHAISKYFRIQSSRNNTDIPISGVLPEGSKCWQFIKIYDKCRCCSINEYLITTPVCRNFMILLSTVDSTLKQHSVIFHPCALVLIFIVFMLLIDIKVFKKSILDCTQCILLLFVFLCMSVSLSVT